jgi:hypothetical protein
MQGPEEKTIFILDANECITTLEWAGIIDISEQCGFVNVYELLHGEYKEFSTHVNGIKVDYMFVTNNVLP